MLSVEKKTPTPTRATDGRFPLFVALLGGLPLYALGVLPVALILAFIGAKVPLLSFVGVLGGLGAVVSGLILLRWYRSVGLKKGVEHAQLALKFGKTILPEHAKQAAVVVRTWEKVMTGIGGLKTVTRSEWKTVNGERIKEEVQVKVPPAIRYMGTVRESFLEMRFAVPAGFAPEKYDKTSVYASSWGVEQARFRVPNPGVVSISLMLADPLRFVTDYKVFARSGSASYAKVAIGIDEDGSVVWMDLLESSALIAGIPGSGKSGAITTLLAGISNLQDVALIGLDPKQVELAPWKDRFSRIESDPDEMTDVLIRVRDEMERRYDWLEAMDRKKIEPRDFGQFPLLVLVIDELAEVLASGATKEEKAGDAQRSVLLRRLIAKGRAAGIVPILATQKPGSDVIPTSIRDNISQRFAFRTTTLEMTKMVLGDGFPDAMPHLIRKDQQGVAYAAVPRSDKAIRMRTPWLNEAEIPQIAHYSSIRRVGLSWI